MHVTSEQRLGDVLEREFTLGEIPGILWTPSSASASSPVPLILLGHPGRMRQMYPRLLGRARSAAEQGFAAVTVELPESGERPASPATEQARADLRRAVLAGEAPSEDVIDRLVLPLVDTAVPEWQATLDAALDLPEVGGPVGYSGGNVSIGTRLALVEPRIVAAGLFAGSFVPRSILAEAQRVTIPLHVLLQWDDENNDRERSLELFDAFGSAEKTLQANMGGHTGVPAHAGEDAARFFARHLAPAPAAT
ncbi:alpha/beta hydrolase [Cellulomonas alba]|uniref:Alpha/beta hydrolase n=1 Tax=Cellulomonas alba TaxID=3053467 RepID=A0ABT7SJ24_9CELL|nr:alpha/beta hydrolase [Cellulomonas alba]MDM7856039.1 alpha/beta hydrolase [Cellulomonas alba]